MTDKTNTINLEDDLSNACQILIKNPAFILLKKTILENLGAAESRFDMESLAKQYLFESGVKAFFRTVKETAEGEATETMEIPVAFEHYADSDNQ